MAKENGLTVKPLKVKLFASAREIAGGKREIELEFAQKSVKIMDLKERILHIYPQMKCIPFIITVNYRIVTVGQQIGSPGNTNTTTMHAMTITPDDEIALLPPISGG
jgi:molybdopterin converting factor small subunit